MQVLVSSLIRGKLQNASLSFVSYSHETITVLSQVYSDRMLFTWQHPSAPVEAGDLAHLGFAPHLSGLDIYWIDACAADRILSISLQTIALTSSATKVAKVHNKPWAFVPRKLKSTCAVYLCSSWVHVSALCVVLLTVMCVMYSWCSWNIQVPMLGFHTCSRYTRKLPARNFNYFVLGNSWNNLSWNGS